MIYLVVLTNNKVFTITSFQFLFIWYSKDFLGKYLFIPILPWIHIKVFLSIICTTDQLFSAKIHPSMVNLAPGSLSKFRPNIGGSVCLIICKSENNVSRKFLLCKMLIRRFQTSKSLVLSSPFSVRIWKFNKVFFCINTVYFYYEITIDLWCYCCTVHLHIFCYCSIHLLSNFPLRFDWF